MIRCVSLVLAALSLSTSPIHAAAIHDAAREGDTAALRALIAEAPDLLDSKDESGRTPLHWACRGVHYDAIKLLVSDGADVNATDINNVVPLHSVAVRGHLEAVRLLIAAGAHLDVTTASSGRTPLHLAAESGHADVVSALLEAGADASATEAMERTALQLAVAGGHERTADVLISASPETIDSRDFDGCTALRLAVEAGKPRIVGLLVAAGANLDLRDLQGRTAYNVATAMADTSIAEQLLQAGADASPQRFPDLNGPYMGQEPPGMAPVLFAKGIVSTAIGMYGTIVFSPDLHEAFWKPEAPTMCHMRKAGDTWGPVREFPFNPEDAGLDSPCYSPDGRRLFFLYLPLDESGHTGNGQIWYAEKKGDDWNVVGELDPTVDSVEKHFQFSVDRGGNLYFSNTDIYCARYDHGVYEAPERLPSIVNSDAPETGPLISPDGDYLIFSRWGGPPMPIRLFISFLGNDGSWTEPQDMTEVIGGEGNDSAPRLSPDGKYLFFQSVRKGSPPARGIYWVDARIIDRLRPRD